MRETPVFTPVIAYPFSHPERVFYNPYHLDEVWVTSFGSGIRLGGGATNHTNSVPAAIWQAYGQYSQSLSAFLNTRLCERLLQWNTWALRASSFNGIASDRRIACHL